MCKVIPHGQNITIFGFGISGEACVLKLAKLGAKLFITETKNEDQFPKDKVLELKKKGIDFEFGGHTEKAISKAELIIVSPGIHLDIPILEQARHKNVPVISEIELAFHFLTKPIIAITGTNGKTTTTTIIGEILKAAGKKAAVAGNIGFPLVAVDDQNVDYVVAEISSYQLEGINQFRPFISVICNIQEDHIERHHSMEEYMAQKARIFMNQNENDYVVFNDDDVMVKKMVAAAKARKIPFSKQNISVLGTDPKNIKIPGRHNLENALAAATAAALCGVSKKIIAKTLETFPGVEHRIELVREIKNVKFYNDSKATNPASTLVALETFINKPLILILGGREKGVDIAPLCQMIKKGVKEVILIGEAEDLFAKGLTKAGFLNFKKAGFSMPEAVKTAMLDSVPGDNVLLSPACASFDMFKNYEERGNVFKEKVKALILQDKQRDNNKHAKKKI